MEVAPLVADVLTRQQVQGHFLRRQRAHQGGRRQPGIHWAPWWKARAAEGHEFASHTWDHVYWRGDVPGTPPRFRVRASAGPDEGRDFVWTAAQYCEQIDKAAQAPAARSRARSRCRCFARPGGKTSPAFLAAAKACGYEHVAWSPAGFLGDELPSETASNQALLKKALRDMRSGDILVAHLGIWSRKDPWAPAVLEPLIVGPEGEGLLLFDLARSSGLSRLDCAHGRADRWIGSRTFFSFAQQWLFETLMQPVMFALGLGHLLEDGYAASGWLLVGLIQIAVLVAVIGPLQRWRPVEPVIDRATDPHGHALHADSPAGPVPGGLVLPGRSAVRRAVRHAARRGLRHVRISTSCGPASPTRRW